MITSRNMRWAAFAVGVLVVVLVIRALCQDVPGSMDSARPDMASIRAQPRAESVNSKSARRTAVQPEVRARAEEHAEDAVIEEFEFSGRVVVSGNPVIWQDGAVLEISDGEDAASAPVGPDGTFAILLARDEWDDGALVNVRVRDGLGGGAIIGKVALISPCWIQCGERLPLRVRVVDAAGSPVAGVNVSVSMTIPGNPWWSNRLESGATSEDGSVVVTRYLDPVFVPRRCSIAATPPKGPTVHVPDVPVADLISDEGVVVELRQPAELEFELVTADGGPVPKGSVVVSTGSDRHEFVDEFTRPVVDGRAVFQVAAGSRAAWYAIGAAGGLQSGTVAVDSGPTRVRAVLDDGSLVHDVIVRATDPRGRRVESARVTVFPERPLLGPVGEALRVAPWDESLGAYVVRVPREMFPLRIMTFVSYHGFAEDLVVGRPGDISADVRFPARGNLRLMPELVDAFAVFRSGPLHVVVKHVESGRVARYKRLVGPWTLEWLTAGPYDVFVAMADGAYVGQARATVAASQQNRVEVRLRAASVIEGRVRRDGDPRGGLTVQITGESAWHGVPWSRCTTNDSGSFRITGMPANVVTLGVLDRDGTLIREFRVSPGVTPVNLDL